MENLYDVSDEKYSSDIIFDNDGFRYIHVQSVIDKFPQIPLLKRIIEKEENFVFEILRNKSSD